MILRLGWTIYGFLISFGSLIINYCMSRHQDPNNKTVYIVLIGFLSKHLFITIIGTVWNEKLQLVNNKAISG